MVRQRQPLREPRDPRLTRAGRNGTTPASAARRGSQAIDRALSILSLFDEQHETLAIADIADALAVHRSTAWRMVGALERAALVEQDPVTGRFRLGLALVSLAGHVLDRFPARASGRKVLSDLRDQTGETAYLGVLDGLSVVYIDQASSPHVRHNVDWVGRRQSLTEGVTGAMLLAFQPEGVIADMRRLTGVDGAPTAHMPDERELAGVRERGYLARFRDPLSGLVVVGAPVRDFRGEVVAAITIAASEHRVDRPQFEREVVPATVRAAALVSESLGYTRA